MKKIAMLAVLLAVTMGAAAQNTKKEARQQRRAERAEMYRQSDTTEILDDNGNKVYEDGIYKTREKHIADVKKGATEVIVTTSFETPKEVFDILMRAMIQEGNIPKETDKEYFIIRSEKKQVYNALYDIRYVVYQQNGKVKVRANGTAYGSFSVGAGLFRSNTDMVVPVEYKGIDDSLFMTAWKEIDHYVLNLPLIELVEYIKP